MRWVDIKHDLLHKVSHKKVVIDYEKVYLLVICAVLLWFLISLTISKRFNICFIDVVTIYLYESLDIKYTQTHMQWRRHLRAPTKLKKKVNSSYFLVDLQ